MIRTILEERKVLGKLRHPFICNLNYAFQDESFYCLVLDFVDSGDLRHHLDRYTFTEETVRHWIAEISCAVEYLHEHNIVHRDIKPENVLINSRGHVCLADFNIARELTCKRAVVGGVSGTFNYLAPEIYRGLPYTELVDWWALGVVFYECIYKRLPFRVRHRPEIFKAISGGLQFPEAEPPISEICQHAISRFLEVFPPQRVQSCDQIFGLQFFQGFDRVSLEAAPYIMGSVEGTSDINPLTRSARKKHHSSNQKKQNDTEPLDATKFCELTLYDTDFQHGNQMLLETYPNATKPRHVRDISDLPVPLIYEIEYHPDYKQDFQKLKEYTGYNAAREEMKNEYQKWYSKQIQMKIEKQRKIKELAIRKEHQQKIKSRQRLQEEIKQQIIQLEKHELENLKKADDQEVAEKRHSLKPPKGIANMLNRTEEINDIPKTVHPNSDANPPNTNYATARKHGVETGKENKIHVSDFVQPNARELPSTSVALNRRDINEVPKLGIKRAVNLEEMYKRERRQSKFNSNRNSKFLEPGNRKQEQANLEKNRAVTNACQHQERRANKNPIKSDGGKNFRYDQAKDTVSKNENAENQKETKTFGNFVKKIKPSKETIKSTKEGITTTLSKLGAGKSLIISLAMIKKNAELKRNEKKLGRKVDLAPKLSLPGTENRSKEVFPKPKNRRPVSLAVPLSSDSKLRMAPEPRNGTFAGIAGAYPKNSISQPNLVENNDNRKISSNNYNSNFGSIKPNTECKSSYDIRVTPSSMFRLRHSIVGTSNINLNRRCGLMETSGAAAISTASLPIAKIPANFSSMPSLSIESESLTKCKEIQNVSPICNRSLLPYQLRHLRHYKILEEEEKLKGRRIDSVIASKYCGASIFQTKLPACNHVDEALQRALPQNFKKKLEIQLLFEEFDCHNVRRCECHSSNCPLKWETPNMEDRATEVMTRWKEEAREFVESQQAIDTEDYSDNSREGTSGSKSTDSLEEKDEDESISVTVPVRNGTQNETIGEPFDSSRGWSSTGTINKSAKQQYSTFLTSPETTVETRTKNNGSTNGSDKMCTAIVSGGSAVDRKEGVAVAKCGICDIGGKNMAIHMLNELHAENERRHASALKLYGFNGMYSVVNLPLFESLPIQELRKAYTELIGLPMGVLGTAHGGRIFYNK